MASSEDRETGVSEAARNGPEARAARAHAFESTVKQVLTDSLPDVSEKQ